jgi:hypothetical protein
MKKSVDVRVFLENQDGKADWTTWLVLGVVALAIYGGVALFSRIGGDDAPKVINADGETYLACRGQVSVNSEGGGLFGSADIFKVSFTDVAGLSHTLRGIHKVQISDVPKMMDAPMPINPGFLDRDGKPMTEGNTYTWTDGTQARYEHGQWVPAKVPNDACSSK